MCVIFQVCFDGVDDGEKDRHARELAATRIQAITRGKRFRKKNNNNDLEKAAANNSPRRRPHENGGHEQRREDAGCGRYRANYTPGGAPSAVSRSGDVSGGAPAASAGSASAAAGGGGGGGGAGSLEIDRKTVTLIASLVDERITVRERKISAGRPAGAPACSIVAQGGCFSRTVCSRKGTAMYAVHLFQISLTPVSLETAATRDFLQHEVYVALRRACFDTEKERFGSKGEGRKNCR